MRRILGACFAVGMAALPITASHAEVTITAPGVSVQTGPSPYWRHDGSWRAQREWAGNEYRHPEWQHDHCVRDWQGNTFCR